MAVWGVLLKRRYCFRGVLEVVVLAIQKKQQVAAQEMMHWQCRPGGTVQLIAFCQYSALLKTSCPVSGGSHDNDDSTEEECRISQNVSM